MEISLFLHLLQNISKALSRKELARDYDDLLQNIFAERGPHDEALTDPEMRSKLVADNFPLEKVFGRYHEKEMLMSELMGMDRKRIQLSVIPILGGCGIGKTTLAQLVYDDKLVKKHFDVRAWVKVEGQELELHHAAHGVLKSTMGMPCALDDPDELDEMVRDVLQSQRCLIVFDGIESMSKDSWLHMRKKWFDFVDLGSKVLITTTSKDVADLLSNQGFELSQLSPDVGLSMYRYLAFDSSEDADIMSSSMAENFSALCKGIPLSLKLVGSFMRYDGKLRNLFSSEDFSDGILLPPSDASVVILLCVWALPPHLRKCLAYCAIFPKGHALSKEKIIDMWIAHGLVNPSPGNNSLRDISDSYFHQLLCRSFFTDITRNQYDNIIEFRIPRLIHMMAEDVARIVYKEKLGLIGSIGGDAAKLHLLFPFTETYHPKHLQTLILSPTIYSGDCSLDHSLLDFKDLQSLDLSCSGIRNLSDDICALKELRYLNISYTLIERLPDPITNLSWLQTLNLTGCYHLQVLPKKMRNLTHMEHLDLWLCDSLSCLPSGIGFLTSLTSMPLFVLGKDHDCARVGELGLLNQLRGRLEIRNLENVREISEAREAKLDQKNLHRLGLSWSQNADDCFQVLELLEPNPNLKVFDLTGYMGFGFPKWISSINSLIKISITDCGCKELPSLGQLPFLKELQLKEMTNLERIGPELYGDAITEHVFPSLEQLGLYDLPRLSEWSGETTLPNSSGISFEYKFRSLKTLAIEGCPKLTSLPSLPTLSDLIVWRNSTSILASLTSFTSLSSLLINDMELGVSNFQDLSWLDSLKKLVLCNIKDKLIVNISHVGTTFTALEHLGILHCHQLNDLRLFYFSSLEKLHIVDCPNLFRILVSEEENTPLVEVVVEDCPEVSSEIFLGKLPFLRKLIVKNSGAKFTIDYAGEYKRLEKLEYLSISGCPRIERELQTFPSLISHVPCIIVGDHKAKDMQDLMEVLIKTSYDSEAAEDLILQISDTKPDRSPAVPKFEEWDETDPAAAEGQGQIFNKVREGKYSETRKVHSRGSPEYSPNRSPRMTSPGPVSRIHSGAVTPLHPRAGGGHSESQSNWPDDAISISISLPFSHQNSAVTSPSVPRSPGRAENLTSPGSSWKKGKLLGRGTFGHVYLGFNSGTGEMCAMKEVTLFSDDAKSKESAKLGQEIVLLSRLSHPNIVQYYGSETVGEKLYIYLEYVSGGSIHKILQEYGKLGELAIRSYTQQILSGLAYLHAKNTVHGDIKGANILVDPNGRVKLADFGMAKHIKGQSCILWFKGSPHWMAPEVIRNSNGRNLAVDIWSLGCTVIEMATSKPPWSQYEGVAAMFKIVNSKELPTIPDHLSDEGKDFVRLCLQRNPLHRPTAGQLLEHSFVKRVAPLEKQILSPTSSDHPAVTNAAKPVGIGNYARILQKPDTERLLAIHSSRVSKSNFHSSDINIPRNISSPVSSFGSPLLHPR